MARYKFIGTDGSMGYKKGKVYRGSITRFANGKVIFIPGVFPFNLSKITIPYSSIKTFEKNWERL